MFVKYYHAHDGRNTFCLGVIYRCEIRHEDSLAPHLSNYYIENTLHHTHQFHSYPSNMFSNLCTLPSSVHISSGHITPCRCGHFSQYSHLKLQEWCTWPRTISQELLQTESDFLENEAQQAIVYSPRSINMVHTAPDEALWQAWSESNKGGFHNSSVENAQLYTRNPLSHNCHKTHSGALHCGL